MGQLLQVLEEFGHLFDHVDSLRWEEAHRSGSFSVKSLYRNLCGWGTVIFLGGVFSKSGGLFHMGSRTWKHLDSRLSVEER